MSGFDGTAAQAWTTLTHAGTSGTVTYVVLGGFCYVRIEVGFTSVASNTPFTLVTSGNALPSAIQPQQVMRGRCTSGAVVVRADVNADGTIVVTPLGAASTGAVGYVVFPAGL